MNEFDAVRDLLTAEVPTDDVVERAWATLVAEMEAPVDLPVPAGRSTGGLVPRGRFRGALVMTAAAASALGIALAAVGVVSRPAPHHRVMTRPVIMALDGFSLTLPGGFVGQRASCLASPPPGIRAETVLQSMRAAASTDGGCLEAALVAGAVDIPPDAQPVTVGTQDGDYVAGSSEIATLFVSVPAAQADHYLVLTADGLSEAELIAIAASAFPAS